MREDDKTFPKHFPIFLIHFHFPTCSKKFRKLDIKKKKKSLYLMYSGLKVFANCLKKNINSSLKLKFHIRTLEFYIYKIVFLLNKKY